LLQPLSKNEALHSSSLEGTHATPEQLLLFSLNPTEPKSVRDQSNAWLEVANYDSALKMGCQILQERPLSIAIVKELHARLLKGVRGGEKLSGHIRTQQVYIGPGTRFVPPPPHAVLDCLEALIRTAQAPRGQIDPLVLAFMIHYQFGAIHPFEDGNGRIGRVILSLLIWKWSNHHLPWLYMSAYFEKNKNEYFDALYDVSATGNWERWIEFCLHGTIEQAKDAIRRCELLVVLKKEMHRSCDDAARLHSIIDDLFNNYFITIPAVAATYNISYPTAKNDVARLIDRGILSELPGQRPKVYFSTEMRRICYNDDPDADRTVS
jgi:Fic family protein